jgi:membrane protein
MIHHTWQIIKRAAGHFAEDEALTLASSVAYYSALSLAPIVLLFIAITGFLGTDTQQQMVETVRQQVGAQAGQMIESVATTDTAEETGGAGWSTAISIVVLLFSASGVLAALQNGLNHVWDVKPDPEAGLTAWIRKRALSMGMVLVIGFLLLVSMIVSGVLNAVFADSGWIWTIINLVVSFGVFVLLFAALYKVLPDVELTWRQVWFGAIVTALLFAVGKYLIGLYLGTVGLESRYGAAGSMVALLIWVYYSAVIVFFGAEITQARAALHGQPLQPNDHAVRDNNVTLGNT